MLQTNFFFMYLFNSFFYLNIYIYITAFIFILSSYLFNISYKLTKLKNKNYIISINKIILIFLGLTTFVLNYLIFFYYLFLLNSNINLLVWGFEKTIFEFNHTYYFNSFIFIKFSPDLFGLILLLIATFVGFISFFTLDTRLFLSNIKNILLCYVLVFFIFLYIFCTDIIFFFFCYEGLLLPSFWLVYFLSPNRRGVQASIYFLLWTQFGSLLVLTFVVYILQKYQIYLFSELRLTVFDITEVWWLYFLIFFGFGFKIPIWPFHFWLTKTHVEAPTGFSIFLSGFLVKSALFGFYKLSSIIGDSVNTSLFSTIAILGVVDSSFKMWGQSDLKKLIAYSTIQEMNLIFLTFLFGDSLIIYGGILFCVTHALLSTLFFFIVDCIYRRFKTRNVVELQGLLHITPTLGIFIFFSCILYMGLPGTLKFICEFYIFSGLFETAPISTLILVVSANFIGALGFCKCWFNVIFGMNNNFQKYNILDLTNREILIKSVCCFLLLTLGFYTPWIF